MYPYAYTWLARFRHLPAYYTYYSVLVCYFTIIILVTHNHPKKHLKYCISACVQHMNFTWIETSLIISFMVMHLYVIIFNTARLSSNVEIDTSILPRCCGHTPSSQIWRCGISTRRRRCLRGRPTTGNLGVGRSVQLRRRRRNLTAVGWSPSGGSCGRAATMCAKWCPMPSQSCCRTCSGWRLS